MNGFIKPKCKGVFLIFMGVLFLAFSCSDNGTEPAELGPDVPPASTFLIDFGAFPGTGIQSSGVSKPLTFANWGWAGINVLFWNAVITVHGAVPVAAFLESFRHVPVKQEDDSWLWSYSVIVDEDTYTANLYASTDVSGINWSMYLSKAGEFTDFLWFSGEHDLLYTEGTWTIYKAPDDPVQFIGIEWHRNLVDSTADITYTNIEPESEGNGGYITFGVVDDPNFDAFYGIYYAEEEHNIDIEWNLDAKVGRVMDEIYFGDDLWHCWDEDLEDVDCDSR